MRLSTTAETIRPLVPGLVVSATLAMAATFLSEHHGGPTLLYALLIGMSLHFLSEAAIAAPGIQFVGRMVLRIAMLGVRISVGQIVDVGQAFARDLAGADGVLAAGPPKSSEFHRRHGRGLHTGRQFRHRGSGYDSGGAGKNFAAVSRLHRRKIPGSSGTLGEPPATLPAGKDGIKTAHWDKKERDC